MGKFSDYFNNNTIRGRANVAKATYASIAAIYLYKRFTRKKNKPMEKSIDDASLEEYDQQPQDYDDNLGQCKCPSCGCSKENEKLSERQDLHEATPPKYSHDSNQSSPPREPHLNQDNDTAMAESIIKSSTSKSPYVGKQFDYNADSPPPDKGSCP